MKKILFITHLSGKRVNRLWMSSIVAAKELGLEFHLACNMAQIEQPGWDEDCKKYGIITHQIDFNRNPLNRDNKRAYRELLSLMQQIDFDIIHCNTPIGGVLGRMCAKKVNNHQVIYQAHGFHFWKGAPVKNWLFYYPVEKYLAKYTDTLITINEEDFAVAKKFKLRNNGIVTLVRGVGVNIEKFRQVNVDIKNKRNEFGIPMSGKVLLSVGEINSNKNHEIVIKALARIHANDLYYIICGDGEKKKELKNLVDKLDMHGQVIFAGFRFDINEIMKIADYYVFPSHREGLSVALMEAMASGLPCIVSDIRGNRDLMGKDYKYLFNPDDSETLARMIQDIERDKEHCVEKLLANINFYSFNNIVKEMKKNYQVYLNVR